jgi:proline dehydrogenase
VLRAILIYLSKAKWSRRLVTGWRFARRAASRFVAGDTLDEAVDAIHALNANGLTATLDHLGENVTNAEEAVRATDDYILLLEKIQSPEFRANASLKLTQLGLGLDFDLALSNMRCIARQAASLGTFVRIDMEDSPTVDHTLQIHRTLREEGFDNIGLVIQSYLYRSREDTAGLLAEGTRLRLVKGAYKEPADIAYPRKADVDRCFDDLTRMAIDASLDFGSQPAAQDGRVPPLAAIGTHDEKRIDYARKYAETVGLPKPALEFQMLYGIRSDLQRRLAADGYPVRVYVPYGTEWYPYFMRRLAERPANIWFFLSNLFRR